MSESYAEKAGREGPLPKMDDDSDLVGEEEQSRPNATERKTAEYFTIPAPGAGSFPVPQVGDEQEQDGENAPAEQEAER